MESEKPPTDESSETVPAPVADTSVLKPIRIWPAVVLVAIMPILRLLPKLIEETPPMLAAMGPTLCGVLILVWWLTASCASWRERLLGLAGVVLALTGTLAIADATMRGPAAMVWTIPIGMAGFAIGALIVRQWTTVKRTWTALGIAAVCFAFSAFVRNDGMWGDAVINLQWRWTPTAEDQMLAQRTTAPAAAATQSIDTEQIEALKNPDWPGFRGADRISRQHGVSFSSDWTTSPPELLWKISVGPAWSSFAVAGKLLFTQEQRGVHETIICYDADSGDEMWTQQIEARFDDPMGGPGPRATPELADGKLFVLGADGDLLCLNPVDGEVIWQQNIGKIADREPPMWGFSSSPLVIGGTVIVHAGGADDKGTLAFDATSGELKWSAPAGDHSYSSAQLATIAGEDLVLMPTNLGLKLLDPATGKVRLNYEWEHKGYRALQAPVLDGSSIVLPTGSGTGTRRIRVTKSDDQLIAEEEWHNRVFKPDFNDFVIFDGHIYGFDGGLFACFDAATGERKWKGGRYGKGQVLLLEDSGLLLIAGERGQGVLLNATSEDHEELATAQLLKGKTWNHPVVVGERLYIRNAEEAACYRLPLAQSPSPTPVAENVD